MAGPVAVTVSTAGGTSNPVSYTYLAAPTVTALSPDQGPTSGGNTVTLTGTNLAQTTTVLFGTTPTGFTVVSDNHIVADAPPGPAGPVGITVITPRRHQRREHLHPSPSTRYLIRSTSSWQTCP
ncbi:hypothetical protein GCM10020000_53440 [Streptomyces olivoverticillatus]